VAPFTIKDVLKEEKPHLRHSLRVVVANSCHRTQFRRRFDLMFMEELEQIDSSGAVSTCAP
jgi:hypothetical protein